MFDLLAQVPPKVNFWSAAPNTSALYGKVFLAFMLGVGFVFLCMNLPTRYRRTLISVLTFVAGLFFVLSFVWPKAEGRAPDTLPNGVVESVAWWLQDATGPVSGMTSTLTAFLLGLGAFSMLRVHIGRLVKQQKDWGFSLVLLISMFVMMIIGYWDWRTVNFTMKETNFNNPDNWIGITYAKDLVFDGILQKMDAAMFSIIAFYIMSAAYRAFRIRSVEATVLLVSALIVMMSLLALGDLMSSKFIGMFTHGDKSHFMANFTLSEIYGFIRAAFQTPSIRAIDFGIGVGALAMGLRLWLSLDKTGGTN
ncbi:MAG: hypothetical protein ABL949_02050 [Fimbriimonadaceae bacterium]